MGPRLPLSLGEGTASGPPGVLRGDAREGIRGETLI